MAKGRERPMQINAQNNAQLRPKQRAALEALLTERTKRAAAARAGVSERQLYTWLKDPVFKSALLDAETQARNEIKRRIIKRAESLADTIADIMESDEVTPAVRLQAAARLGDLFFKTDDQADLDARITALELQILQRD